MRTLTYEEWARMSPKDSQKNLICEVPDCLVIGTLEEMIRLPGGERVCPNTHGRLHQRKKQHSRSALHTQARVIP